MNRFFYFCPQCLFRATAEADTFRAPFLGACPVCAVQLKLIGATKGVLSYQTPCDDRCTYATGQNCSCSCGGKNHGSKLVVPVINGVIDLSHYPEPVLADVKRDWLAWKETLKGIKQSVTPHLSDCLAAYAAQRWLARSDFDLVREFYRSLNHAKGLKQYAARMKAARSIENRFCTPSASAFVLAA